MATVRARTRAPSATTTTWRPRAALCRWSHVRCARGGNTGGLEARVTALEAGQADYRAVLAAINALAANQREHAESLNALRDEMKDETRRSREDVNARFRSQEEADAEMKDLLIRALDR